ncbi:MAG: hypothetical protein ACRYF4_12100 [Janthinobacterium lividum]
MKKFLFSAAAMLVLAGSSASAITIPNTSFSTKPKPTQPTTDPDTNKIPPMCPPSDPNGCGILD